MEEIKQAKRIQTSILNGVEKKALVWLAERQPRWVSSDFLTIIGVFGAVMICAGYILTNVNVNFLWLASLGLVVNWYGDSLDGTLARVRGTQRPVYGYYLDHTVDGINEGLMFVGVGLSGFMHLPIALLIFIFYLLLTINVSINAHLKKEFRLTYAGLGPTEFRILGIILNTVLLFSEGIKTFSTKLSVCGLDMTLTALDLAGIFLIILLAVIHVCTITSDARGYAKIDPKKEYKGK